MEKITFNDLLINESIKKALDELGYKEMTPIQEASLPTILEGKDVIAQAPTGTGKTCCYAIPICNSVNVDDENVQALVLCPTRELSIQVTAEMQKVALYMKNFRIVNVYGGQDIEIQIKSLKRKPQVIVGTPGRIMDHLRRHTLKLTNIKTLVLDEADEMLDMGFKEDLDVILEGAETEHQTVLFSATMPDTIKRITKQYQKDAILFKTTFQNTAVPDIKQYYVQLDEGNKIDCLSRMIDTYNFKQALVFCRTKKKTDDLSYALTSRGYQVECLHGDMRQASRDKVMKMFREGLISILIATDVAARGLDIDGIDVVFNFDITDDVEYYIHRIGRTARAGRGGCSYTFVTRKEVNRIKDFEKEIKKTIEKIDPPTYKEAEKKKIKNLLNELFVSMNESDYQEYTSDIYQELKEGNFNFSIEEVAGAFLKKLITTDSKFSDAGLDLTISLEKGKATRSDYTRLFINLGRMDNLSKITLTKLVCENHYVESSQVMGIEIKNTFSFFEVPTAKAKPVIDYLNEQVFNGRKVDTQVSSGKKQSSDDSPRRRRSSLKNDSRGERRGDRRRSRDDSKPDRRSSRSEKKDFEKEKSFVKEPLTEIKLSAPKEETKKPRTRKSAWDDFGKNTVNSSNNETKKEETSKKIDKDPRKTSTRKEEPRRSTKSDSKREYSSKRREDRKETDSRSKDTRRSDSSRRERNSFSDASRSNNRRKESSSRSSRDSKVSKYDEYKKKNESSKPSKPKETTKRTKKILDMKW